MTNAIIPGTYDPITLGHVDLIRRALHKFDKLHCVVATSSGKNTFFSLEERVDLVKKSLKETNLMKDKIVVDTLEGLTVDYCVKNNISVIIRGLRGEKDLTSEAVMSYTNSQLGESLKLDTFFLIADSKNCYTSSSLVKELAMLGLGHDKLEKFVTKIVAKTLSEKC